MFNNLVSNGIFMKNRTILYKVSFYVVRNCLTLICGLLEIRKFGITYGMLHSCSSVFLFTIWMNLFRGVGQELDCQDLKYFKVNAT